MNIVIFGATGMVVYGYKRPIIESADIEQLAREHQ